MHVPSQVTLTPDGFETELAGRRAEERAAATVVAVLSTLALAALLLIEPWWSMDELFGLAIWALVAVAAFLAVAIAYVVVAPVRTTPVRLAGFTLHVGRRRLAIAQVRGARVRGGTVVVEAETRHVVPASHVSSELRRWVADRIVERLRQWQDRDGEAPPELEALRRP